MQEVPKEAVIKGPDRAPHLRTRISSCARNLEQQRAARCEYSHKLGNVPLAIAWRHVLQSDVGINEIEMLIGKYTQVVSLIHHVLAAPAVLVVVLGLLNHRGRDVHPIDLFEMLSQWLGETADTTSEIERAAIPQAWMQGFHLFERPPDFPDPGLEELACIPAAVLAVGVRENRPQWVAGCEQVPVLSQRFQIQIQLWTSRVR